MVRDTAFTLRPDGVVMLPGNRYALCSEKGAEDPSHLYAAPGSASETGDAD